MTIRPATAADVPTIVRFIRELAEYEQLLHECHATENTLRHALFPPHGKPAAEALIAELDRTPQGYAIYFTNFSTFLCKPGIYLEDLYVTPAARGWGLGRDMLIHLAKLAESRGYGRFEWSVLDWNAPAIGFYKKLGAEPLSDWTVFRVSGAALSRLASMKD